MGKEVGVHVLAERLEHFERRDTGFVVNRNLRSARFVEFTAVADIHVDELLREVPARSVGPAQRVFENPFGTNFFRSRQHLLIRFRRIDIELFEDVLAIDEVLRVCHERHRHHLAIDGDKLVGGNVLPVGRNEIVQRADDIFVDQRHDRGVRDNGGRVFCGIALHAGQIDGLVIGRQVRLGLGQPLTVLRVSGHGLDCGEFIADDAQPSPVDTTVGSHGGGCTGCDEERACHQDFLQFHIGLPVFVRMRMF